MSEVPRRLPRTQGQRIRNVAVTHAALSGQGMTAAARPVPQPGAAGRIYSPPGGDVVVGSAVAGALSITSTGSGPGSSNASDTQAIAVGDGATAAYRAIAVGSFTTADQFGMCLGTESAATGLYSFAGGWGSNAAGGSSVSLGPTTEALADGCVAIGADNTGAGAHAVNANDFVLGTANHHVIVNGGLILADSSGGLHRLVVSTGGALSTVAYP